MDGWMDNFSRNMPDFFLLLTKHKVIPSPERSPAPGHAGLASPALHVHVRPLRQHVSPPGAAAVGPGPAFEGGVRARRGFVVENFGHLR